MKNFTRILFVLLICVLLFAAGCENIPESADGVMKGGTFEKTNGFGFYYNKTINSYYEHQGVDYSAEVGASVFAFDSGSVLIEYDDVLHGTQIIISHKNNVKTLYRFIVPIAGLSSGDTVEKGEKIATVSEAIGEEYKDGPHLHFEMIVNGKNVDPETYKYGSGSDGEVGLDSGLDVPMEFGTYTILHSYGFYHNQTLNSYYEHQGVDFAAEIGTAVYSSDCGTVEILEENGLLGGQIIITHENNIKTLYRFVTPVDGLTTGDTVVKGEKIATISEACGEEYKDGPHLHFEILVNNKAVNPEIYFDKGKDELLAPLPAGAYKILYGYGFYHNKTLNSYHEHQGVDFSAEVGVPVYVMLDGVVTGIVVDEKGSEISVTHNNGIITVYRYVVPMQGLKIGDIVTKGCKIATISEACGEEYKDGPHLHFAVIENGNCVDPEIHFDLQ